MILARYAQARYHDAMSYKTLISTNELADHLGDPDWAVIDCRFALSDTDKGQFDYQAGHIPGAVYAHLDHDLTGPIVATRTGRHPLPSPTVFARTLSNWGIDSTVQVVVYDDAGGAIAGRLWWMLRWMGHDAVALLDGGWNKWQKEQRPTSNGTEARQFRQFTPNMQDHLLVDADFVLERINDPNWKLIDSRAPERYRGDVEPLDALAGHIRGAVNSPHTLVAAEDCTILPPQQLADHFKQVLGDTPPDKAVFYCGSGVTAAHNLLALAHAGLGDAKLYSGSWSDWIVDPTRPYDVG